MEAAGSSETYVLSSLSTQRGLPEDNGNLCSDNCENLKPQVEMNLQLRNEDPVLQCYSALNGVSQLLTSRVQCP
jgi:hypothetical protein